MCASRIETALGLCRWPENRGTIDVAAGTGEGAIVVADGIGGHCTGWLGARLAVHAVLDAMAGAERRVVGAADGFPNDWGWSGDAPKKLYDACAADLGVPSTPRDLVALFDDIDRVVSGMRKHASFDLLVGCLAATIDGTRIAGVHAGIGRAVVLRRGAANVESLVVEHFWHLIPSRVSLPDQGVITHPPDNVIINGLGQLRYGRVGVDRFEVTLKPGDVLVMSSRRLAITDTELVRAADPAKPLDELVRTIERLSAPRFEDPEHDATNVAFALARAAFT